MKLISKTLLGAAAAAALLGAASAPVVAQDYKEIASPGAAFERTTAFRTDTIEIELAAAKDMRRRHETEYMIYMQPDDTVVYSLVSADATDLWHEFHGHTADAVTFYKKAGGATHHGSMKAPFEGEHGWYLENRGDKPVKVQLKISGFYKVLAGD